MAIFSQLEKLNLKGKIVKPFSTHEGSGLGSSLHDIRKYCPGSDVKEGLAIRGSDASNSRILLESWIKQNQYEHFWRKKG